MAQMSGLFWLDGSGARHTSILARLLGPQARPLTAGSGIWCAPAIAHGSLAKILASDATMRAASMNEQSSANFRYRQTSTALEFNAGLQPFHRECIAALNCGEV
jgi:hypothetical protein